MFSYIARRTLLPVPVLGLVAVLAFVLMHLVPGDPALALLGTEADSAALARLRQVLALDRPIWVQFSAWIGQAVKGDFGRSIGTGRPVLSMLAVAAGPTASLTAAALAVVVGVPAGVFAATRRISAGAAVVTTLALFGLSVPGFWLGLLLIMALAVWIPLFPASGHVGLADDPVGHLRHLVLPALTLGIALAASTVRVTRTAMLQALRAPHVRTALAKGLPVRRAVWRHGFATARVAILAQMAVQAGKVLGGVVVIETVFAWPGLGKLVVDAVFARDYPVIQGAVLLIAAVFVLINLAADVGQALLDPRVRRS